MAASENGQGVGLDPVHDPDPIGLDVVPEDAVEMLGRFLAQLLDEPQLPQDLYSGGARQLVERVKGGPQRPRNLECLAVVDAADGPQVDVDGRPPFQPDRQPLVKSTSAV
ncbi:hypothetical protein OCS_04693 [Ophiocordyceps sinensis CO18]|uniref:Uncharacterized protein n=1 Tax=Ophiocordyceps sinensis (strain Co18 / CGMCC 3.14243) TaxID=911162 RepID=T5ACY2_OPHSC|nr:hypothetical protein OCS_04693 [Ophiocordyceps sinensis CO18]